MSAAHNKGMRLFLFIFASAVSAASTSADRQYIPVGKPVNGALTADAERLSQSAGAARAMAKDLEQLDQRLDDLGSGETPASEATQRVRLINGTLRHDAKFLADNARWFQQTVDPSLRDHLAQLKQMRLPDSTTSLGERVRDGDAAIAPLWRKVGETVKSLRPLSENGEPAQSEIDELRRGIGETKDVLEKIHREASVAAGDARRLASVIKEGGAAALRAHAASVASASASRPEATKSQSYRQLIQSAGRGGDADLNARLDRLQRLRDNLISGQAGPAPSEHVSYRDMAKTQSANLDANPALAKKLDWLQSRRDWYFSEQAKNARNFAVKTPSDEVVAKRSSKRTDEDEDDDDDEEDAPAATSALAKGAKASKVEAASVSQDNGKTVQNLGQSPLPLAGEGARRAGEGSPAPVVAKAFALSSPVPQIAARPRGKIVFNSDGSATLIVPPLDTSSAAAAPTAAARDNDPAGGLKALFGALSAAGNSLNDAVVKALKPAQAAPAPEALAPVPDPTPAPTSKP